jgi:hypothetical protein
MPICSKCGQGYEEVEFHRCQGRSPTFIFRLNSPWLLTIATLITGIILDLVWLKVGLISLIAMQLILVVLIIWSLVWAYTDAQLRNKPGWAVALLILFLFWPISILIWIVFRPD